MFVVHETTLAEIQSALVTAAHGLTNERGERVLHGTFDSLRLEMAALTALQIAVGEPIWPSNRKITLPKRQRYAGPFEEEQ